MKLFSIYIIQKFLNENCLISLDDQHVSKKYLIFIMQMVSETLGNSTSFCLYASAWKMFQVSSNAVLS